MGNIFLPADLLSDSARRQLRVPRSVHDQLDISDVVVSIQVAKQKLGGVMKKIWEERPWRMGSSHDLYI